MSATNPFTNWLLGSQVGQGELDRKMRDRVAENSVNAQKAQDENLGPDIRALDPYMRPESRSFNKYQFKHSALKNREHGVVCSWKAAAAYATSEQKTRDALLAKIKAEKEAAAAS